MSRRDWDGHRQLAADVILHAIADYFLYRSPDGKKLRHASMVARRNDCGRVVPKEWERLGVTRLRATRPRLLHLVSLADPAEFLKSNTAFHEILDLEPDDLCIVLSDPVRLRRLEDVLGKKGPRNTLTQGPLKEAV